MVYKIILVKPGITCIMPFWKGLNLNNYQWLFKGSALLQKPELMRMFIRSREAIEQYMNHDDWHFWVSMKGGGVTLPVFQSLEAFWPGLLSLAGMSKGF